MYALALNLTVAPRTFTEQWKQGTIPVPLPLVVGHEGSGVVEKVGADIKHVTVGDHVLLTYNACLQCTACLRGNPAYCVHAGALCFGGSRLDGSMTMAMDGADIHSAFFGQSSFACRSVVRGVCAVKVDKDLPLHLLCPLGCGIQTGVGTILNVLKPSVGSSIAIFGAGSVGLAGIMAAARFTPAAQIIAVDIVNRKLALAKEFGATHIINSKDGGNVVEKIMAVTKGQGADFAFDATGNLQVIQDMIAVAAKNGTVATVGSAPFGKFIQIEPAAWIQRGVNYTGACQGSSLPQLVRLLVPCEATIYADHASSLYLLW